MPTTTFQRSLDFRAFLSARTSEACLKSLSMTGPRTIGSSGFLPAIEKQNSFVLTDNLTWIHGRHSAKFGTEIRNEQFTLFEPAAPRGTLDFASDFTDSPAAPTTGGEAFATFLLGVTDAGSITNTHNVDCTGKCSYGLGQDDFRMTQRLTLNLGLRYELFTTIKAAGNEQATFQLCRRLAAGAHRAEHSTDAVSGR